MNKAINKCYTVYKHTAPNKKVYIGITGGSVQRRWQGGRNYKSNNHFNNAIKKYKPRRKHTEEEKQAISRKLKGRPSPMKNRHWSEEQKARVGTPIICLDNGAHYCSIHEAAEKTGVDRRNLLRVLKGEYKQTGGLHFEYEQQSV